MFWPEKGHETWRKRRAEKRSAQRPDLAGGLVRRRASRLYLREAKVEMGRTEYQEVSQHSGWKLISTWVRLKGQPWQKGYTAPDLSFFLLMSEHVFLTSAVMQCTSRMLWNYCHMLLTGTAAFCIGMKSESYELFLKWLGIKVLFNLLFSFHSSICIIYLFLQKSDVF